MKIAIICGLVGVLFAAQVNCIAYAQRQNETWRAYSSPDKSFSVELPAPLVKVKSFDGEHGVNFDPDQDGKDISSYAAIEPNREKSRFGVVVLNGRAMFLRSMERAKLIEYLSWLFFADDDEIQFMRAPIEIKHNRLKGKEYFYVKESGYPFGSKLFTRGRIFDRGGKIYVLIFVGRDANDLTSSDAERFLNSFRLPGRKRRR